MIRPRLLISALLLVSCPLLAQEWREYEIASLRFEGNNTLSDDQLLSVVQTHETPWWLWKALYSISEKIGEKPEYYDPIVFESDYARLKKFYENNGFYHAQIDTSIIVDLRAKAVSLLFRIQEGRRSLIDSVEYRGLTDLPEELLNDINSGRLFKIGDPFVVDKVEGELRRIVGLFANYGFVTVKVNDRFARRYASTNNFSIIFSFTPGQRYRFGRIDVVQDSTVAEKIDTSIILRHLDFAQGDFYNESQKFDSERNLNRLGIFEISKIDLATDSTRNNLEIPVRVFVRPRPFQELTPEVGINDKDNAFNILIGLGYSNRNFLGGARNFSTRGTLQIQSIDQVNISRVFSETGLLDSTVISYAELSMQIVQPYFITNKVSISATLSAILDKQKTYYNPILQSQIGLTAQTSRFTRMYIDWNLQRISPRSLGPPLDPKRLDLVAQFNSIIDLTVQRDKRNDLFSPWEGFFQSGTIEEAGLLPSALGQFFGTQLPYSKYYKLSGLAQWYGDASGKRTTIWALRVHAGFAELYGHPTSPSIPITRRFFAGGSSSVRGWRARTLGAMADSLRQYGGSALFEGNAELRFNPLKNAGRFGFLDLSKISFVLFYDVGDLWPTIRQFRVSEIAMATGFGLRWDTVAGPIRIDFGMRVYDPFPGEGNQWITQKRFFPETFTAGIIHLGVGHAF